MKFLKKALDFTLMLPNLESPQQVPAGSTQCSFEMTSQVFTRKGNILFLIMIIILFHFCL